MKENVSQRKKKKRVIISFARAERASLPLVRPLLLVFLPQLVSQHAAVRSLSHTISKKMFYTLHKMFYLLAYMVYTLAKNMFIHCKYVL